MPLERTDRASIVDSARRRCPLALLKFSGRQRGVEAAGLARTGISKGRRTNEREDTRKTGVLNGGDRK
jgi:hypothetical protein